MTKLALSLSVLSLGVLVAPAFADPVPYAHPGHVAPNPSLPIKSTGTVLDLYYYGQSLDGLGRAAEAREIYARSIEAARAAPLYLSRAAAKWSRLAQKRVRV